MAEPTEDSVDPEIWETLEQERISPDGKQAIRMARTIFRLSDPERCAEARQWCRFAVTLDRSTGDKLLKLLKDKADKRAKREGLHRGAGKQPLKVVDGGTP